MEPSIFATLVLIKHVFRPPVFFAGAFFFCFMARYSTLIAVSLVLGMLFSCSEKDPISTDDPSNLSFQLLSIDTVNHVAQLQASAAHAVAYALYEFEGEQAVDSNAIGFFEYELLPGNSYFFELRAYGSSGRYLKASLSFDYLPVENEVPLENGYFSPLSYEGMELVWQDEFNGNELDLTYWSFEIGDGCPSLCGWGNNELQYYRAENTRVHDGVLEIEARNENFGGRLYTSSRIITRNGFSFQYGRVDIRALLPEGQGIWPALWMLGANISSVSWPACGEIDIMEMIGGSGRENEVHGTIHWDEDGHASFGGSYQLSAGTFVEAYHVFSIIWDESKIQWFVDNQLYHETSITSNPMSEFHQHYWFIFNVAVGGNWPGNPNITTRFPQSMKVDYVRVFQPIP